MKRRNVLINGTVSGIAIAVGQLLDHNRNRRPRDICSNTAESKTNPIKKPPIKEHFNSFFLRERDGGGRVNRVSLLMFFLGVVFFQQVGLFSTGAALWVSTRRSRRLLDGLLPLRRRANASVLPQSTCGCELLGGTVKKVQKFVRDAVMRRPVDVPAVAGTEC